MKGDEESIEEVSIMEEDWDFLIILDACRYDYFEKTYPKYLKGNLVKVKSPSYHTEKWRKKAFKENYDDVVYVSANPYLNSKVEVKGFDARVHFHEVIDVWDWGWDDELGTVPPEKVNEATRKAREKYPRKRLIIHYLQPHAPYISLGKLGGGDPFIDVHRDLGEETGLRALYGRVRDFFGPRMVKYIGWGMIWRFRELLELPPINPEEAAFRKVGKEGMREAYVKNLSIVLKNVVDLLPLLSGKVVISADHGELLGENGDYLHHAGEHSILLNVPWFEVEEDERLTSE